MPSSTKAGAGIAARPRPAKAVSEGPGGWEFITVFVELPCGKSRAKGPPHERVERCTLA
jgi:hypothetical protein